MIEELEPKPQEEDKEDKYELVIFFSGTGNNEKSFLKGGAWYLKNKKVIALCVKGCEAPEVCGDPLFPNLEKFSERFTNTVFDKDGNLVMDQDKLKSVGVSTICYNGEITCLDQSVYNKIVRNDEVSQGFYDIEMVEHPDQFNENESVPINSVNLAGFSRGAAACFKIAQQMNKQVPNIKVNIVADQPVSGNQNIIDMSTEDYFNCRECDNIEAATILLGSYTGLQTTSKLNEESCDTFHRILLSQVVPQFKKGTRTIVTVPIEHHNEERINAPSPGGREEEHLNLIIAKSLAERGIVEKKTVEERENAVRKLYRQPNKRNHPPCPFPPVSELQKVFGLLKTSDLYLYKDPYHPDHISIKGMELKDNETIIEWWERHNKKTSFFSSRLTKDLVNSIKKVDLNDSQQLFELFKEADRWLILKNNLPTSRGDLVTALRNNLYLILVNKHKWSKTELDQTSLINKQENHFFLTQWREESKALSSKRSPETLKLDKAFEVHSQSQGSKEDNNTLLKALDDWLEAKKEDLSTKRYGLVERTYDHLKKVSGNCYSEEEPESMSLKR